jgi:hypothetical protein
MVVAVVFTVPVTLMKPPALGVVIVVRMGVIRSGIGAAIPAAGNPYVAAAGDIPVAIKP